MSNPIMPLMPITQVTHLLIDAGNTRIKWAFANLDAPMPSLHNIDSTASTDALPAGKLLSLAVIARSHEKLIIVASNVAGEQVAARLTNALQAHPIHFISSRPSADGFINRYTDATTLGTDRFAALIAVQKLNLGACLVVMVGTALTMDALTADGEFLGGAITPGLALMRSALKANTARLPLVIAASNVPIQRSDFARDTIRAIENGTTEACAGAIMLSAHKLQKLVGTPITIVLSGGDSAAILPLLENTLAGNSDFPYTIKVVDNVVLRGLAHYAKMQLSATA